MINASNINTNTQYTVQRPKVNRRYSALKYGYSQQGTNNVGITFPFFIRELSPSDKASFQTNINMQFSPFVSQLFAKMTNEISGYKLPYRVLCEKLSKDFGLNFDWESFITGGDNGQDIQLLPSFHSMYSLIWHNLNDSVLRDSDFFDCYYENDEVAYFYKKDSGRFPLSVTDLNFTPHESSPTNFTGVIYIPRCAIKFNKIDNKFIFLLADFDQLSKISSMGSGNLNFYLNYGTVTLDNGSDVNFVNGSTANEARSELYSNFFTNTIWDSFGLPMPKFDNSDGFDMSFSEDFVFDVLESVGSEQNLITKLFKSSDFKFFCGEEIFSDVGHSALFSDSDVLSFRCFATPVNAMPFVFYNLVYNDVLRFPDLENARSLVNIFPFKGHEQNNYFTRARIFQQRGVSPVIPVNIQMETLNPLGDSVDDIYIESVPCRVSVVDNKLEFAESAVNFSGSDFSIDDMLQGLLIMRYQVNNAKMRSRYIDHLRYRFGIDGLDSRLQLPEYLGSFYQDVYQTNVVQTAPASNGSTGLGTITSVASVNANSGVFSVEAKEHEIVMFISVCRPDMVIEQGVPKWLVKKNRFDFVIPELVDSPDVPILKHELIGSAYLRGGQGETSSKEVFGWTSIYDEYRTSLNQVVGRLRPSDKLGLRSFTLARLFDKNVELNGSFIQIPNIMNRVKQYIDEPDFVYSASVVANTAQPLPVESEPGQFVGL